MSEAIRPVVIVAKLRFEMDGAAKSPVTLRVKPDRRQRDNPLPAALERRLSKKMAALTESRILLRGE